MAISQQPLEDEQCNLPRSLKSSLESVSHGPLPLMDWHNAGLQVSNIGAGPLPMPRVFSCMKFGIEELLELGASRCANKNL